MNMINKCSIYKLVGSLIVSPIIFYITIAFTKISGVTYDISHGDAFIIWVLLAILVVQCFKCEQANKRKTNKRKRR